MLEGSRYYKRDTEKYVNLLETITALNYYHREHYIFEDGVKGVITSFEDVNILLSLLEPYKTSIANNIKPKSAEIYKKLISKGQVENTFADDLKYAGEEFEEGFTTRMYFEKSGTDLSLKSIQRYFSDLYQAGLLKLVNRDKNANVYDVIKTNLHDEFKNYEIDFDLIEYELGSDIAEIIRNDVPLEKDINENDEDIGGVPW